MMPCISVHDAHLGYVHHALMYVSYIILYHIIPYKLLLMLVLLCCQPGFDINVHRHLLTRADDQAEVQCINHRL